MAALLLQILRLLEALARILRDPRGRALTLLVAIQLLTGTIFYTVVEGWRVLDSVYFCVTTLTTAGLGDLAPRTDLGKVFTVLYLLTGVGLLLTFVALIAEQAGRHPHGGHESPPQS